MTAATAGDPRRPFTGAVVLALALSAVFAALLAGPFSAATREAVSAVGFVTGALAIMVSGGLAARRCRGRRRRAWTIVAAAAGVALAGNAWTTLSGGDVVQDPSAIGDALVAFALILTVFGLLELSDTPFRGARLLVNWLDGVVTGCAVLIIATVLVFSRLVEAQNIAARPEVLLFPVLDVAVVTVALLLVQRNQGDRSFYSMVSFGFVLYAVADLSFAVQDARGSYVVGTVHDAMWIAAYLILAAAAWHPAASTRAPRARPTSASFDVQATLLVFGLLVVAAGVQSLFPPGPLTGTLAALWAVLVLSVGVRQVLLVSDNQTLRQGLERRVQEQTADLRRITRRTEVLLNSVGDGIYGVDLRGRITFTNPSTTLLLRCQPSELMGRHAHDVLHASADAAAVVVGEVHDWSACYVQQAIRQADVVSSKEDTYRRADGTVFPVEVTASPLIDDGEVLGAVVVFRDVTERREIDRMKEEFLSIVSHELRTPLTSIRGSLGMLGSETFSELPASAQRMITIATRSSDRLTRLINDILDVERIRSGKFRMECLPHDVEPLLQTTIREMSAFAAQAGVTLELGRVEGVVLADADRVVQTLTNIVGNAVKFSRHGTTVRLEAVQGDGEVVCSVADRGRGVPADKLHTIFDPFAQVDSSDSREKGGTGLGLAICRGIVERHGGRIWAESELGIGTTVHFTLPESSPVASGPGAAEIESV